MKPGTVWRLTQRVATRPMTRLSPRSATASAAGGDRPLSADRWLTAKTDSQSDSQRDGRAWIDVDKSGTPGAPPNSEWTSMADAGPWSVDLQNRLWGGAEPSQVGSIPIHPRHNINTNRAPGRFSRSLIGR